MPSFLICNYCHKVYKRKKAQIKYCSVDCRNKGISLANQSLKNIQARSESIKKALIIKNKNQQAKRLIKNCAICGKQMSLPPCKDFRINCSKKCYGLYMSQTRIGENHPNYTDGKSIEYGPRWHIARKEVKIRDNYTCKFCGSKKNIHVHHIDENKKNNDLNNLITICSPCHLKLHGPKQNRRPLT